MPSILDQQFQAYLKKALEPFQKQKRFLEDCESIECIIDGGVYKGRSFQNSHDLVLALKYYFKNEMKSHQRQFLLWKWHIQPEENDLVIALTAVFFNCTGAAIAREMKQACLCGTGEIAEEMQSLMTENKRLRKELGLETARADQMQWELEDRRGYMEALAFENQRLQKALLNERRRNQLLTRELCGVKQELSVLKRDTGKQLALLTQRMERVERERDVHQKAECLVEKMNQREQSSPMCSGTSTPIVSSRQRFF